MKKSYRWLTVEPHQRRGVRVLQVAMGLMLLFRVYTETPFYSFLWGPRGVGSGSTAPILGRRIGGLLDGAFATEMGALIVLVVLALGAFGLVLGIFPRLATALALVTFFMIEQRLPELPDGGDNIARIVLMYMLLLLPPKSKPAPGTLSVWFHNLGVLAIGIQVAILYTISGLMKSYGYTWHHGIAMYYISNVEWFSLPALREIFANPFVVTIATYVPMLYQLLFPMAILSRVKLPWLFLGIVFHLGVACTMGLVTFSTVMIGLELFLVTDLEYTAIRGHCESLAAHLRIVPGRLRSLARRTEHTAASRLFGSHSGSCKMRKGDEMNVSSPDDSAVSSGRELPE